MDLILVIILGIIEGITEWLPISSTGHIIVAREIITQYVNTTLTNDFFNMFDVVIQLGAILAIVVVFFKRLLPIDFSNNKISFTSSKCIDKYKLWIKVLIASIPAAIIGILFNDKIEELFNNPITISITLIIYGILFIVIEYFNKKKEFSITDVKQLSYKIALIIGVIQLLALIPGTSRSGVTILGAMLLSCDRTISTEFSFFLSIPIMFGASLLKIINFGVFTTNEFVLLIIGMIVSFVISLFVVKFLLKFIKKYDFSIFGYYRIIFGIIVLVLFTLVF